MKILVCHTYYRQRSGECAVVEREAELLRGQGHEVSLFTYDNRCGDSVPSLRLAARTIYSRGTKDELRRFVGPQSFDVAHVHNTWLMASPSLYPALGSIGVPVVKTIHNYRWLCPVATFYRGGRRCHDCLDQPGGILHAILHRCYGGSVGGSVTAAARLSLARDVLKLYQRFVDVIIVQNEFVESLLVRGGFDRSRMVTKGNFVRIPPDIGPSRGEYLIFYGRHEASKGLATLLDAMGQVQVPLRVYGEGPMTDWLQAEIDRRFGGSGHVKMAGHVPRRVLDEAIAGSRAVVFPSEWYESYPLTIVEAMAFGKPVIASNLGGGATIVKDGLNGLLYPPGDAEALAARVRRLWQDRQLQDRLEAGAREAYLREMTPEASYTRLMYAYDKAREVHSMRKGGAG